MFSPATSALLRVLRNCALTYGLPLLLVVGLIPDGFRYDGDWASLHAVLEIVSVTVAVMVFMVGWNAHILNRSAAGARVGALFLLVAILDTGHLLSFPGMPDWLTPSGDAKSVTFWIAARLIAAAALLIAASSNWSNVGTPAARRAILIAALAAALFMVPGLVWLAHAYPQIFSTMGGSTAVSLAGEYLVMGLIVAALVQEFRRFGTLAPYDRGHMMLVLLVMILAELCFIAYARHNDAIVLIGHIYMALAYILLYRTLIEGMIREPYRRLRQAESVASHSRDELRSIFMAAPDGVIVVDDEGLILQANLRFTELTGYSETEVKGLSVDILVPERFRSRHRNLMRDYIADPTVRPMAAGKTLSARRRDGTEFPMDVALSPLVQDGMTCIVATLRDVSERVAMMRQLVDSEARIRGFLDNSVDWVWETNPAGIITYSSQRVQDLLGFSPQEVVGCSLMSLMVEADAVQLGPHIREIVMRREPLLHLEHSNRHNSGAHSLMETNGTPFFGEGGSFLGYRGVTRDISTQKALQKALERSEGIFRHAFDDFPTGMAFVDRNGRIFRANAFLINLLGFTKGQLEGMRLANLFTLEARWEQMKDILALCDGGAATYDREVALLTQQQQTHWVRLSATLVDTEDGSDGPLLLMASDIAGAKEIASINERLLAIIERMGDSVGVADRHGKVLYLNPYARTMLGVPVDEDLSAVSIGDFHTESFARVLYERALPLAERNGVWEGEMVWRTRSGEEIVCWQAIMAHKGESGVVQYWTTVARDIRERKRMEEQLSHQATHDALTGLPNRALLSDRLQQAIALARRERKLMAVIFIDLDNFKRVNDTLDHSVGDLVLQTLAKRLTACLRSSDTLARQGGDEFIAVLPNLTTVSSVVGVLDKMVEALNRTIVVRDREIYVTASLGISVYPFDHDNGEELLRKADVAMYKAKERGRNGYQFYTSDMDEGFKVDLQLESELRRALENEELTLHYQPQYSIGAGAVTGLEALVRWNHPVRGLVFPGDFIGVAERSMLIAMLGEWVLREVCRQIRVWLDAGCNTVPVAFNLSSSQFDYVDVADQLRTTLAEFELDGEYLELEITEGVLMRDPVATTRTLSQIKSMGVRIAVDDFGTGYSSLAYLKRFPVDVLKIDRSFVTDVAQDSDDAGIVRAIISMAHNLSMSVVAEGVETPEQLAFLAQSGCDFGQGYLFSRPQPAAEIETLLNTPHGAGTAHGGAIHDLA